MKNSKVLRMVLLISGLIATGIILFLPAAFHATNGIDLGGNSSLLSEVRAPGGALMASGILIMSGAFVAKLTFTFAVVSTLLYFSYGLSRILSMAVDGLPAERLVQAAVLELVIGLVCIYAFITSRRFVNTSKDTQSQGI